jgi:hypothetical protein
MMKEAVEITRRTLEARARLYRNVVVAVVALLALVAGASLLLWSPRPLAGLALLVPICGGFLLRDGSLVQSWQRAMFEGWQTDRFRLADLKGLLRAHRYIPPGSLTGMLTLLPDEDVQVGERGPHAEAAIREARLQQRRTLAGAVTGTLLVGLPAGMSVVAMVPLVLVLGGAVTALAAIARS